MGLDMHQLGRLGESRFIVENQVPFWHSPVQALELNSLGRIQTLSLSNWVAFSGPQFLSLQNPDSELLGGLDELMQVTCSPGGLACTQLFITLVFV